MSSERAPKGGAEFTEIYTDGACSGNPGPGGWAWVVADGTQASGAGTQASGAGTQASGAGTQGSGVGTQASGAAANTTNQRMEVQAVLEAIRANPQPIHIFSDSTYVVNCFRDEWHVGWVKRGWKNSQRKPVANRDLWEPLIAIALPRLADGTLKFSWVKGHSGNPMNDLADELAVAARDNLRGLDGAGLTADTAGGPGSVDLPWDPGPALLCVGTVTPTAEQLKAIDAAVASLGDGAVVVSGLRRGSELAAAEAALAHRVELAAVLPFPDPARKWDEELRSRFDEAYGRATYEVVLGGDPGAPGTAVVARNRWLERAALGALVVGDDDLADQYTAAGLTVLRH